MVRNSKGVLEKRMFDKFRIEFITQRGDMSLQSDSLEDKNQDGNTLQVIIRKFGDFSKLNEAYTCVNWKKTDFEYNKNDLSAAGALGFA